MKKITILIDNIPLSNAFGFSNGTMNFSNAPFFPYGSMVLSNTLVSSMDQLLKQCPSFLIWISELDMPLVPQSLMVIYSLT